MNNVKCPRCRKSDDIAGVCVRGIYDGVLYWECMACATVWHKFRPGDNRYDAAHEHIENRRTALRIAAEREWNRERASRGLGPYDQ